MILPALLAMALGAASPCTVCRCAEQSSPEAEFRSADAVFTATVVSVRTTTRLTRHGPLRRRVYRLRADAAWKGVASPEITVTSGMGGGDCGIELRRGVRHLVYAYRDERGRLAAGLCSRTAPVEAAKEDLRALGDPERRWPRPNVRS